MAQRPAQGPALLGRDYWLILSTRCPAPARRTSTPARASTSAGSAAKEVFDKALADGWGDLDIACVHDQISGASALSQEGPS